MAVLWFRSSGLSAFTNIIVSRSFVSGSIYEALDLPRVAPLSMTGVSSRVYAALKQPELAMIYAKSSLDICEKNGLRELRISAYEGMARAHASAKEFGAAKRYLEFARKDLKSVSDYEDRLIYSQQISETEALIHRREPPLNAG